MIRQRRFLAQFTSGLVFVTALVLAGCVPAQFEDGLGWTVRQYRATDARYRAVADMPFLRIDDYSLDQLRTLSASGASDDSPANLVEILARCHELAITSVQNEIDHLPSKAIDEIWLRYFQNEPEPKDRRAAIRDRYVMQLRSDYTSLRDQATASRNRTEATRIARSIVDKVGPSVKDQRGSGLLLEAVQSQYERDRAAGFTAAGPFDVYAPPSSPEFQNAFASWSPDEYSSLVRFAPILLQERRSNAKYPARVDEIGKVNLSGSPGRIEVHVETSTPVLYAYTRKAVIRNHAYQQLLYCWWFPEHPSMTQNDPEAGLVDGATICITLDSHGQPAVVETIQNCGCHIHCFANSNLEEKARRQWKDAAGSALEPLEKPADDRPRLTVAGHFVTGDSGDATQLYVISRAGYHDVIAVHGVDFDPEGGRTVLSKRTYDLVAYDTLENLPTQFGKASMFGPDGLVHNAGRPEGWLLAPTGMRSAGQPRQRGTQMVCWDALDFDDPHLLEKTLRLPNDF
ncbi:MAG: hypothetical protein KF841_09405 [Phycisphaerae bacterium]|nr:hypothetical protein [Phycisphaerae bacterium]